MATVTMKVPSSALDLTCMKMKELITASATVQRKMQRKMKKRYKYSLERQFGLNHLKVSNKTLLDCLKKFHCTKN